MTKRTKHEVESSNDYCYKLGRMYLQADHLLRIFEENPMGGGIDNEFLDVLLCPRYLSKIERCKVCI
jgi:hypothetical protein